MNRPLASIRRFDVFAEYNRLEQIAEGLPEDQAKGYGLWIAKVVAARKFGRLKPGKGAEVGPEEMAARAGRKFRSLSGVEQTDLLFDKQIVARMGRSFYEKVFRPAVGAAFKSGKSYKEIRDSIRKDWQVKLEPASQHRRKEPRR